MSKDKKIPMYIENGDEKTLVGEGVVINTPEGLMIEGRFTDEAMAVDIIKPDLSGLSIAEPAKISSSPIQRMDIREQHRLKIPTPAHPEIPRVDPTPITMQLDANKVLAEGDWYIQGKVRELVEGNPQFTRPHISIEENYETHAVKLILSQGPTMQPRETDAKPSDNT